MANRWADGLGRYGGTKSYMLNGSSGQAWAQVDGEFSLSGANPRTGSWHLHMAMGDTGAVYARRVFGAPLTEVFVGFAMYAHTLPTTETTDGSTNGIFVASLRDQTNAIQCELWLGTDGALEFSRGYAGARVVLGRSIPIIGAGAYQHIEIYAKASNSVGAFEVRVDEVTRLNLTGIDTVASANVEFSQFAVGHAVNGNTAMIDFADFFCNDTAADGSGCDSFVGDVKSGWLPVNADTAQADFTLSTGVSGYPLLNDVPPDDADYITTASTTAESDYGLTNGPGNLSEILTARPAIRAKKDDAGTCTVAPSMISNAVKAAVSGQPITTAFAYYDSNVPINPDTGVPWTASNLNAAVEAIERTA